MAPSGVDVTGGTTETRLASLSGHTQSFSLPISQLLLDVSNVILSFASAIKGLGLSE